MRAPGHAEYNIRKDLEGLSIIKKEPSLPWSVYVGAAGMPGTRSLDLVLVNPSS
jgi:hypothetical protein